MEKFELLEGQGYIKNSKGEVALFSNALSSSFYNSLFKALDSTGIANTRLDDGDFVTNSSTEFSLVSDIPNSKDMNLVNGLISIPTSEFAIKLVGSDFVLVEGSGVVAQSGSVVAGGFDILNTNATTPSFIGSMVNSYEFVKSYAFNTSVAEWVYHEDTQALYGCDRYNLYKVAYDKQTGVAGEATIIFTASGRILTYISDFEHRIILFDDYNQRIVTYDVRTDIVTNSTMSSYPTLTAPCYDKRTGVVRTRNGYQVTLDGVVTNDSPSLSENVVYYGVDHFIDRYNIRVNGGSNHGAIVASTNGFYCNPYSFYDEANTNLTFIAGSSTAISRVFRLPDLFTTLFPLQQPFNIEANESVTIGYKFKWGV